MRFEEFARINGLLINSLIRNRWVATPTEDRPRSNNGRYKYLGRVGWVQNWATMDRPSMWQDDKESSPADIRRAIKEDNDQKKLLAEKASKKAGWILHQCKKDFHPYLAEKGFEYEVGNVWDSDGKKLLVIPMRIGNKLIGCQLIDCKGSKKFLYGQTSKSAVFAMNAKGLPIFCEGLATGLSIREVLKASNIPYNIQVCFSASNMKTVASTFRNGIIVADNDASQTGEIVAWKAGKPYWISPTVGEDFNDFHKRVGVFEASQDLKKVLMQGMKS